MLLINYYLGHYSEMLKILLGVLIGILATIILLFCERKLVNPYYVVTVPKFITDTTKRVALPEETINASKLSFTLEEKSSYINKRIDDILIFCGIIITLLLAINISVFVNAERLVQKHMTEHFEEHEKKILSYVKQVEQAAGKAITQISLTEEMKPSVSKNESPQKP